MHIGWSLFRTFVDGWPENWLVKVKGAGRSRTLNVNVEQGCTQWKVRLPKNVLWLFFGAPSGSYQHSDLTKGNSTAVITVGLSKLSGTTKFWPPFLQFKLAHLAALRRCLET